MSLLGDSPVGSLALVNKIKLEELHIVAIKCSFQSSCSVIECFEIQKNRQNQ